MRDKTFTNEPIEVDRKYFIGCNFYNVRLIFRAEKEFALQDNKFHGPVIIQAESETAKFYGGMIVSMLREAGLVDPQLVGFVGSDIALKPPK